MGKDKKTLRTLRIEDTMQEGEGGMNTSHKGNPDGTSRMLMKGEVRRV